IALSADRKWMLHRTEGFCNTATAGVYTPPRLCVTNLEASQTACLTDGIHYRTPDFAPEGNWFVFAAPFTGQEEIWKAQIQADGSFSNFVQLTNGPAGQPARWPSWSGDGNWIVFQRDVDTSSGEDWRLFTVRADGVGVRALDLAGERPALLSEGGAVPLPPLDHAIYLPGIIA